MNTRIIHCRENLKNYYICIEKQVAGFPQLTPSPDFDNAPPKLYLNPSELNIWM